MGGGGGGERRRCEGRGPGEWGSCPVAAMEYVGSFKNALQPWGSVQTCLVPSAHSSWTSQLELLFRLPSLSSEFGSSVYDKDDNVMMTAGTSILSHVLFMVFHILHT